MEEFPRYLATSIASLRRLKRVVAWLLCIVALLVLGVWGGLNWLIVPRISEWRLVLEERASQTLGVRVQIGGISADDSLFSPTFMLTDVQLRDQEDRVALNLPQVRATLSLKSIWNLGFERLHVARPALEIRRDKQGRVFVAGLELATGPQSTSQASDWLFSQPELVIESGQLRWIDEQRGRPELDLRQVDVRMRNGWRRHELSLDATPPQDLGSRFSLKAKFDQPLFSSHSGQWSAWNGYVDADFERVDIAHLKRHAPLWLEASGGTGALRARVEVRRGEVVGATADVALSGVGLTLGENRTAVLMNSMSGRLGGKLLEGGFEFFTEELRFETDDGLRWPGGSFRVSHVQARDGSPALGVVSGERLDLGELVQIAKRLPLEKKFKSALTEFAPKGTLEQIQAYWRGPLDALTGFEAKGRVAQFEVKSSKGVPGISGLSMGFDMNQSGGHADVTVRDGSLELPGWFEDPSIQLAQLSADLRWQINGEQISVQSSRVRLSNADAQGEAQFKWRTADVPQNATGAQSARYPGVLDLQGSLSRAEGARVHRYLPLVLSEDVRNYVRDAVTAGQSNDVRFRVRGNLHDMPFHDAHQGEFRISAKVKNADFAYVPSSLQSSLQGSAALPWPALTKVSGNLIFDRASLQLQDVSARLSAAPSVHISRGQARIADMTHEPQVQVGLELRGPMTELLQTVVNGSPLLGLTEQALAQVNASGLVQGQLNLQLPLDALEKSTVQGQLRLLGNDFQITPDLPRLSGLGGVVHFSERGFALADVQGRALGGEFRAKGGMIQIPGSTSQQAPTLQIQGAVTAEGLSQARELGPIANLGTKASGRTPYTGTIKWNRGTAEILFTSNLQGLGLNLPAPFDKRAATSMPFKLATELLPVTAAIGAKPASLLRDQMTLEVGTVLAAKYVRDISTAQTRVLRGTVALGASAVQSLRVSESGVSARLALDRLDADFWLTLMASPSTAAGVAAPAVAAAPVNAAGSDYIPSLFTAQIETLIAGSHRFNKVVAGGSFINQTWQANIDAREFSGYFEYRQPTDNRSSRVYARLARLALAQAEASEVEAMLDKQAGSLPALDIVIQDTELLGKKLGRVEIEAINRSMSGLDASEREWRLNKLNILMPEASFIATGNWAGRDRRKTTMKFSWDIADAGELLGRLGKKDVFRRGKGKIEGQVAWVGSPLALDYPSLSGAFNLNVENGQFLKAEPGLAKLLGVLSLQTLPRRLALDFRDVFSEGFAFDFLRGDVQIEQGLASTSNLQMKGVSAAVLMEGKADIAHETQDLTVVVVPEISAGSASILASIINPAIALSTFVAELVLRRPLIEANTHEFKITGSWADPQVVRTNTASAPKKEAAP